MPTGCPQRPRTAADSRTNMCSAWSFVNNAKDHRLHKHLGQLFRKELPMPRRLDPAKVSPAALKTMLDIEAYLAKCGLERPLIHLIKMRASQINGCAYCLDMHSKDARAEGDTEQRLYALDAWRETPFYSARERAA